MERFPSKRDGWLIAVLATVLGISCVSLLAGLLTPGSSPGLWSVAGILLAASAFVVWIWTGTEYLLSENELLVRSGPFRWQVPVADIHEIRPTKSPLSSPALSLDRLEIRYGKGNVLLISPQDKDRFLRSLAVHAHHLEFRGDSAVPRGF